MWWGGPYQDTGHWMVWGWWMPLHGILALLIIVLVILGVVALVRALGAGGRHRARDGGRSPGLDLLEERYARGEIEREEYLQKKRDLGG